ncbi:MAG: beta-N-acetylhexosaminidase [Bacteroidota bacterium]
MKKFLLLLICICIVMFSCEKKIPATPKDLSKENLIPKPYEVKATGSSFRLTADTKVIINQDSDELKKLGAYFAGEFSPATGFEFPVVYAKDLSQKGNVYILLKNDLPDLGKEGYQLLITEDQLNLGANSTAGLFRGMQTIRQLLPVAIYAKTQQAGSWEIASGIIKDFPRFGYRGAMLDVARHFFGVEEAKQFIDWCAQFKMNYVHFHLTDDQGWRIEIKKWPKLTEIGGSTEVGGGEGGFYTQEDYMAIVKYAQDRHITIVPEIDMPGHTNAALASYAELNCDGKTTKLYTGTEVGFSTFCTSKEVVYEFVDDVVKELAAMTPGPYIHIGGDESHVTKEKDYIKFINRVQDIVNKHGKQMMGWDDVVAAKLESNSVAQNWAKEENAKSAVAQNVKLVMSPAKRAYLDMQYDSTTELGLHWAGYIEIDDGYTWDPTEMVEGATEADILGVEAPLWTETVTNMDEVAYLVFPRLLGYAEIGWSPQAGRDWEEYKVRLGKQQSRLDAMGLNFYASKKVPWEEAVVDKMVE